MKAMTKAHACLYAGLLFAAPSSAVSEVPISGADVSVSGGGSGLSFGVVGFAGPEEAGAVPFLRAVRRGTVIMTDFSSFEWSVSDRFLLVSNLAEAEARASLSLLEVMSVGAEVSASSRVLFAGDAFSKGTLSAYFSGGTGGLYSGFGRRPLFNWRAGVMVSAGREDVLFNGPGLGADPSGQAINFKIV